MGLETVEEALDSTSSYKDPIDRPP